VPEFEVRLFSANEKDFKTVLIEAKSDKDALPQAAQLAKRHGASFFEMRRPASQRWVRK
jgi:hypothetical protein